MIRLALLLDPEARAVSVHSASSLEALNMTYGAESLASELGC